MTLPINPHEEPGMLPMEFTRLQEELQKRNAELAAVNAALRESEQRLEQRVEERTRELSTLLRASGNITTTLELEPLLGLILDQLREVVEYSLASVSILENDDELLLLATRGDGMPAPGTRFPLGEGSDARQMLIKKKPIFVPDLNADTPQAQRMRDNLAAQNLNGMGTWMNAPLVFRDKSIGLLALAHPQANYYNSTRVELAMAFANQAAAAIENARLFANEQRRAEQFHVIGDIGTRITSILELDELLIQVTRLIQQAFQYYHVGIGMVEKDEVVYRVGAGELWDNPNFQFKPQRLKIGSEGVTGWVASTGKPVIIRDVSLDPHYVWMQGSQTKSELIAPIVIKGTVVGVLDIQSDQLNGFDETDLGFMQSLANQVAVAIENARLFATEQRRAEQFRVISDVGRRITSILSLDQLLVETARTIRESFGYHHVHIGMVEGDSIVFKTKNAGPPGDELFQDCEAVRLIIGKEGLVGWAAGTGEPVLVQDVIKDPRFVASKNDRTRSEAAIPIKIKGNVIGILEAESDRVNGFDHSDMNVLQSLADQVAVAIENARLYEQSHHVAALEERQKLARELHDSVSQALYGIALGARTARMQLDRDPAEAAEPMDYILSLADAGLAEMRALIFELRPESLQTEGLVAALGKLVNALGARYQLEVRLEAGEEPDVSIDVKESLYRIAQEAMNNIAKHARATHVQVKLSNGNGELLLNISDNGAGFDASAEYPGHLGMHTMRERAEKVGGIFTIESAPNSGTRILATIPM